MVRSHRLLAQVVKHPVQYLPPVCHPPVALERPKGTRDMGSYYVAFYTEERRSLCRPPLDIVHDLRRHELRVSDCACLVSEEGVTSLR